MRKYFEPSRSFDIKNSRKKHGKAEVQIVYDFNSLNVDLALHIVKMIQNNKTNLITSIKIDFKGK